MTVPLPDLLTIGAMAATTYATRAGGYLALRDRTPGPRTGRVMRAAPGCVLLAVIAPQFVSGRLADTAALALTLLAAARLPMLAVVTVAVASDALLRQLVGPG